MPPPIIIIGMHRSGTTLIARILEEHGLFIGNDLEKNGESRFFLNINRWILDQCGGRWDTPTPVTHILSDEHIKGLFARSIEIFLNSHRHFGYLGLQKAVREHSIFSLHSPWGWKDPRNTVTLPIWLKVFPEARVINIVRHGIDVANSLHVRNNRILERHLPINAKDIVAVFGRRTRIAKTRSGISVKCSSLAGAFDLWHEYMRFSRLNVDGIQNIMNIKYEDFLTSPSTYISGMLKFCGLTQEHVNSNAILQINPSRAYAYKNNAILSDFSDKQRTVLSEYGYD